MNTQRNEARRLEEEIFNAGASSPGEQVTPLEEDTNIKQRPTNPLPLTDDNIRTTHHKMTQDITTDGQAPTTQSQDMTTQANREVVHHPHQRVNTMASCLRDFTQMNPPTFYGSKVDEDPQEFIDEISKILLSMGCSTSEKDELDTYHLKDVA